MPGLCGAAVWTSQVLGPGLVPCLFSRQGAGSTALCLGLALGHRANSNLELRGLLGPFPAHCCGLTITFSCFENKGFFSPPAPVAVARVTMGKLTPWGKSEPVLPSGCRVQPAFCHPEQAGESGRSMDLEGWLLFHVCGCGFPISEGRDRGASVTPLAHGVVQSPALGLVSGL